MIPASHERIKFEILEQTWLGYEPPPFDLCSHGRLWLEVKGQVILDGRESYGISETALALLRTLDQDHKPLQSLAEKLVFHGCGTMLMMSCPIGVNWTVIHADDQVQLSHFRRWDSPDEQHPQEFSGLAVTLSFNEYRNQVVAFASQVREFFQGEVKQFFDVEDQLAYERFWSEFELLFQKHAG